MAVVFQKQGDNALSVSWNYGDIENCGGDTYRYYYRLYKDNVIYSNIGPTFEQNYTWFGLPPGTYRVEVDSQLEPFGPGSGWSTCTQYASGNITIAQVSHCIPSNATDISGSRLAKFYGLSTSNLQFSGPNNPSTAGSIMGESDLPASGTISKARPNAVSELRGSCGGVMPWGITGGSSGIIDNTSSGGGGRLATLSLTSNGTQMITSSAFMLSQVCSRGIRNLTINNNSTSSVTVTLQATLGASPSETIDPYYSFRILENENRANVVYSTSGFILKNTDLNISFTVSNLFTNGGYYYEYVLSTAQCSVQ